MKTMLALIALAFTTVAPAQAASPAWICGLEFQGHATGAQFLVGVFTTQATGQIRCTSATGKTYVRNVSVSMDASPISPSIGLGDFEFAGGTAGITLFAANPNALLGNYLVEGGHAALVGGVGAFVAEKLNPPQLSLNVSVQLVHGIGFDLGIHRMTIAAM